MHTDTEEAPVEAADAVNATSRSISRSGTHGVVADISHLKDELSCRTYAKLMEIP